jgi:hypothetical protein
MTAADIARALHAHSDVKTIEAVLRPLFDMHLGDLRMLLDDLVIAVKRSEKAPELAVLTAVQNLAWAISYLRHS